MISHHDDLGTMNRMQLLAVPIQKRQTKKKRSLLGLDSSINASQRNLRSRSVFNSIVELSDYYNNEYVGVLGVGTPPQYLTVVFDTGSTDVWFPSSSCKTCGKHNTFDTDASSTFSDVDGISTDLEQFHINYGSGGVYGDIVYDAIEIGNISLSQIRLGLATYEDEAIASFDMDGICGLAFYGLAAITYPTILDSIALQYPNTTKSFSMFLSSDPNDHTKLSWIMFGGYDLSIVSDNATFFYTPVVNYYDVPTYWTVLMTGFVVGDQESGKSSYTTATDITAALSFCSDGSETCLAIVDSGTSGIAIPTEYYATIIAMLTEGKDCIDLNCAGVSESDFPVLLISLEPNNVFPLLPADYLLCTGYKQCMLRFQTSYDLWILGDVFIEAYYTHFDFENMRVGFACSGECIGGTWQGTGGYVLDSMDVSIVRRAVLIYSLFILLLYAMLYGVKSAWRYVSGEQAKDSAVSQKSSRVATSEAATLLTSQRSPYNPLNGSNSNNGSSSSNMHADQLATTLPCTDDASIDAAQLDPYSIFTLQESRKHLRSNRDSKQVAIATDMLLYDPFKAAGKGIQ